MDFKKVNASPSTITRDIRELEKPVGNIYEAIILVSKRANRISLELKNELTKKLEEYSSYTDNLEEIHENREQIEVSRYYEKLPKPSSIALQEFIDGKLVHRYPELADNQ